MRAGRSIGTEPSYQREVGQTIAFCRLSAFLPWPNRVAKLPLTPVRLVALVGQAFPPGESACPTFLPIPDRPRKTMACLSDVSCDLAPKTPRLPAFSGDARRLKPRRSQSRRARCSSVASVAAESES